MKIFKRSGYWDHHARETISSPYFASANVPDPGVTV